MTFIIITLEYKIKKINQRIFRSKEKVTSTHKLAHLHIHILQDSSCDCWITRKRSYFIAEELCYGTESALPKTEQKYSLPENAILKTEQKYSLPDSAISKTEQKYSLPENAILKTEQRYSLPDNAIPKTEQKYSLPDSAISKTEQKYSLPENAILKSEQKYSLPESAIPKTELSCKILMHRWARNFEVTFFLTE